MHAPLNYPLSILFTGKTLKDVIDCEGHYIISYEMGTVSVFTQTSLLYMYRERIAHHGHTYESIETQSFAEAAHATRLREKILNKIPGLCVAKGVRQVWWWYRSHVTCYTCHIYQGVFYRSDDLLIGTCVPMLCVLVTCTSNSQIGNSKRSIPNSGSTIMVAGTAVVFYLLEIIFYPHSSLFTPISLRFWWTFSVSYLLIDEVFI